MSKQPANGLSVNQVCLNDMSTTMTCLPFDMRPTQGPYDHKFYDAIRSGSRRSAEVVIPIVLELIQAKAVVDVGCGDGTWLAVFRELGVKDMLGLDGEYVDRRQLQIPELEFRPTDLSRPFALERSFDLAISLEVAEHLPAESAEGFVRSITRLAPVVLFSAAIPFQGGTNHLNEQWPDYWTGLFGKYRYLAIDCIRPRTWDDDRVEFWYRQNCFLYASAAVIDSRDVFSKAYEVTNPRQLRLVHPQRYIGLAQPQVGVRKACGILGQSLKDALWRRLGNRLIRAPRAGAGQ